MSRVLVLTFLLLASPAMAGDVELMLSLGLATGGEIKVFPQNVKANLDIEPTVGLTVNYVLSPEKVLEFIWDHQEADFHVSGVLPEGTTFGVDLDYLHFGGAYRPRRQKGPRPFVGMSLGFTRISAEPSGFGSDTSLSASLSGGATFEVSERVGIRVLGRLWMTFNGGSLAGTCGGQGCTVALSTGGLYQLEGAVGVVYRF